MIPPTAQRSIRYEPEAIEGELRHALDALQRSLGDDDARALVGDDPFTALRDEMRRLERQLDDDFRIVLIGYFKRGKSTLVNALIGAEVAPVNALPETVTINEIRWGEVATQRLRLVDGGTIELSAEEVERERLEPLLSRYGGRVSHLEIFRPLPALRGVVWVDTPGAGDVLERFEAPVAAYLSKADMIVVLSSATALLSAAEQQFLRRAVAPQELGKLFIIVNRIDEIQFRDVERVRAHVERIVAADFPGAQVVALSALDELCRKTDVDRPSPERAPELAAAFDGFRQTLDETIRFQSDALHLDRGLLAARRLVCGLEVRLRAIRDGLLADAGSLDAAIASCSADAAALEAELAHNRQEIEDAVAACRLQTTSWMAAFADRLATSLAGDFSELTRAEVDRHLPFFVADRVRAGLEACVQAQADRLFAVTAHAQSVAETMLASLDPVHLDQAGAEATMSLPMLDGMAMVDLVLDRAILGGGLIVDLVGRALSRHHGSGAAPREATLRANLSAFKATLDELIERNYTEVASRLSRALAEAHVARCDELARALGQATELRRTAASVRAPRLDRLDALTARCQECTAVVEELRGKLGVTAT